MKKKIIIILSSCLAIAVLCIVGILIYIHCLFPPRKIEASLTDTELVVTNDYFYHDINMMILKVLNIRKLFMIMNS